MEATPENQRSFFTLRRFNNFLTLIVMVLAIYIALQPYLPGLQWWVKYEAPVVSRAPTVALPEDIPADNMLVLPKLGLNEKIHEGKSAAALKNGVWHRPNTGSPDLGSNTVLAGHRFTYSGQAVFYNLDKVQLNDPVVMYWNGKKYDYKVSNITVVPPTQISVESPSTTPKLTIYTCTPLWSSKNRLVIEATPTEQS